MVKMKITIDKSKCVDCGVCIAACSYGALYMDNEFVLQYDYEKCQRCMMCLKACPLRIIGAVGQDV